MHETEAIESAYLQAIEELWTVYFAALTTAENTDQQAEAFERFKAGLAVAGQAFETALKAI